MLIPSNHPREDREDDTKKKTGHHWKYNAGFACCISISFCMLIFSAVNVLWGDLTGAEAARALSAIMAMTIGIMGLRGSSDRQKPARQGTGMLLTAAAIFTLISSAAG